MGTCVRPHRQFIAGTRAPQSARRISASPARLTAGQTPGGRPSTPSMLQCSACSGAGLAAADERQHGAQCPPLHSTSLAARRRPGLRWLRLPPQATAAPRAGRLYQRHRRRRAESPDAAKVSAGADFSPADIVGPSAAPSPVVAPVAPLPALPRKGLTGLAARIVFGLLLGVSGAIVILTGGWFYMAIACLVAYQASQEYFGFVTSKVWPVRPAPSRANAHSRLASSTQDYFCRQVDICNQHLPARVTLGFAWI